jgi:hypothetical protein
MPSKLIKYSRREAASIVLPQQSSKKFRLNGRGRIFSRSPMVQAVVFRPVFNVAADPGAVRLR